MNKAIHKITFILVISMMVISACSNSSSEETSNSGECSITNISLGTLFRQVTTQRYDGTDTTYMTTFYGTYYNLLIDQLNHVIYNPDSLPLGTDITRITFSSIGSDGIVAYRTKSGIDSIFASTDTLDFTDPRTFVCYSSNYESKQLYTVKINVHQVDPDKFCWTKIGAFDEFKNLNEQKAIVKDNTIYVFGIESTTNKSIVLTSPTNKDITWKKSEITDIENIIPSSIQLFNNKFYTVSNAKLMQSPDGITWTQISANIQPEGLIAASDICLFAKEGNIIYSSNDGQNWVQETTDGSLAYLPTKNWTSAWANMNFNDNFEYILLCGTTESGENAVWKKVIDRLNQEYDCWSHYEKGTEVAYPFPDTKNPVIFNYDNRMLNLGISGDTLSLFYESEDAGRNWEPDSKVYTHPRSIKATSFSCTVDNDYYIWITCGRTGEIWKGRINRLSFKNEQTSFTK